ncbi:hypothetical protein RUM43_011370 [Polyplax serrata]|uniref:Uncharacterized protein n=1 Tax=Polyplax serrata TaxID=468196 RepID=A0AAN8P736_POLSC
MDTHVVRSSSSPNQGQSGRYRNELTAIGLPEQAQVPGFRAPTVVVRAPSTGPWAFLFIVFHLVAAGPHRLDLCGTQLDWLLTVIDHNQNSAIVPFDYSNLWWFPDGHVTTGGLRRHQHFRDRAGSMPSNKWHSSWQKKSLKGGDAGGAGGGGDTTTVRFLTGANRKVNFHLLVDCPVGLLVQQVKRVPNRFYPDR